MWVWAREGNEMTGRSSSEVAPRTSPGRRTGARKQKRSFLLEGARDARGSGRSAEVARTGGSALRCKLTIFFAPGNHELLQERCCAKENWKPPPDTAARFNTRGWRLGFGCRGVVLCLSMKRCRDEQVCSTPSREAAPSERPSCRLKAFLKCVQFLR